LSLALLTLAPLSLTPLNLTLSPSAEVAAFGRVGIRVCRSAGVGGRCGPGLALPW